MKFSLKTYQPMLTADLTKKAAKNIVRECDEVTKGLFQAYVDEKENTYDTELKFDNKGEIIGNSCDCAAKSSFCSHQAALLLHLINGQGKSTSQKIAKKNNTLENLVYDADPDKIKAWLLELFSKNIDLGLAFTHEFSPKTAHYSVEELKKLSLDAVKAVVNNRKIIEIAELKKIIELWKTLHKPVIDDYLLQMGNENAFLRMDAIIDIVHEVKSKLRTTSIRIDTYRDDILLKIVSSLDQVREEEYWDQVTQFFIDRIHVDYMNIRKYYLSFLVQLYNLSNVERKRKLALDLVTQFMEMSGQKFYHKDDYIVVVFNMILGVGLSESYSLVFKPLRYQNEYNCLLIELLMQQRQLPLAEKYCLEQIAENIYSEYNKPYLDFLINIYTNWEDDEKLSEVLKQTLEWSFDFEAYLFVSKHTPDGAEKKKWRLNLQSRARRLAPGNPKAVLFWFQLLEEEQRYVKMLEYLDDTVTYEVIERYAEQMALSNPERFLAAMLQRRDHIEDKRSVVDFLPVFNQLLSMMKKYYQPEELIFATRIARQNSLYSSLNRFFYFMTEQLGV